MQIGTQLAVEHLGSIKDDTCLPRFFLPNILIQTPFFSNYIFVFNTWIFGR